jgi:predicted nucleic acid-binding protein
MRMPLSSRVARALAFYDAVIVGAAAEATSGILFTEDLQNGQAVWTGKLERSLQGTDKDRHFLI